MQMSRRAAVVGAGIAGLTAAIALQRDGWQVVVYESEPRIAGLGAGITLWPNSIGILDELGAGDRLQAISRAQPEGAVRDTAGRVLFGQANAGPLGVRAMHRGDLIDLLADLVGPGVLHTGQAVTDVGADGGLTVGGRRRHFDLIVAADGVHSTVRAQLWPEAGGERQTGVRAFRWLSPVPVSEGMTVWGQLSECGVVPLSDQLTYVFAASRGRARGRGLAQFLDWPDPLPALVADVLDGRVAALEHDLTDLRVPKTLVKGRVVLIGDAAHAMRPHLGQGAGVAIEDAAAVATWWPDLQKFNRIRRRRSWYVSTAARLATPLMMPGSAAATRVRDAALRAAPDRMVMAPARRIGRFAR